MTKLAFVGCGGIMEEHYKHLGHIDGVKMVGHCDVDKKRAESAADRFGGAAFTEYEPMYDKVRPDAVYVGVPPFAHGGIEEAAAERGIHLFIEKPIATDPKTAKQIVAAIRRAKVLSSVAYCFRYYDTSELARRLLKGKAISLAIGHWAGGMPGVWWWRRMGKSGGQLVEQTTHMVDLMRYLCGDVAEVYAVGSTGCMTNVKDYDVHDSSTVSMRLKNGATAAITSSCVCNHGGRVTLEVITPEATLSLAGGHLTVREDGRVTEHLPQVNMYEEENTAFVDAVRSGKRGRIRSPYSDGLKSFLVTCAANQSMASGMPGKP